MLSDNISDKTATVTESKIQYFSVLLVGIYCMLLPFEEVLTFTNGKESVTLSRYLGLLIVYLFTIHFLFLRNSLKLNKAQFYLILFIGFGCLSFGWSINPQATMIRIPNVLNLLLFYLAVGTLRTDSKGFNILILMIAASGGAAAFYTIYAYYFLNLSFFDSLRATIVIGETELDPNQMVFTLLLPFSFVLLKVSQARGTWRRLAYLLGSLLIAYAALISLSRGGMLALLLISIFYFYRKGGKRKKVFIISLVIISAIFASHALSIFEERVTMEYFEKDIEYGRIYIWLTSLPAFQKHWLLGGGLDVFPKLFLSITGNPWGSHNIYLGTLIELGLVGLTLLMLALWYHFKALQNIDQKHPDTAFALKAAFAGMLVQAGTLEVLWRKPFWLILILSIILSNTTDETLNEPLRQQ